MADETLSLSVDPKELVSGFAKAEAAIKRFETTTTKAFDAIADARVEVPTTFVKSLDKMASLAKATAGTVSGAFRKVADEAGAGQIVGFIEQITNAIRQAKEEVKEANKGASGSTIPIAAAIWGNPQ